MTYRDYARMLKKMKRYAEAEDIYLKAIKIKPETFHYDYALFLKSTARMNEA